MARLMGVAQAAETALAAATAKTVLQIVAPTNQQLVLTEFGVAFDGTSGSAEPVQVELIRQSTAGTSSANTPKKLNEGASGTLQATARDAITVEPTSTDIVMALEVHPQAGFIQVFAPYSPQEIIIAGGSRLGIRCTSPAIVNCRPYMKWEE